ncbi:hypothetical protein D9M73_219340 [compost metagenome]
MVATRQAAAPQSSWASKATGPVRVSTATPARPMSTPAALAPVSFSLKNSAPISTPINGVVALKMAE